MTRAEFQRLVRKLQDRRAESEAARRQQDPPPIPDTLEEYLTTWCRWPHEDTLEPVASLNPPQREYLKSRTAFRRRPDGTRVFGADIVGKGRRSRFTSLGLGAIQYEIMREAESGLYIRALTTMQAGTDDILDPLYEQFGFALQQLPEPYRSRWSSKGYSWRYMRGATWHLTTAGNTSAVANKKGRAARWDILHMTDAGSYPFAGQLWDAAWPTIPKQTGSVYVESTFPGDPEHWLWRRWLAAREKRDPQFLRAFFFPWHLDPSRRIPSDHPGYEAAMRVEVSPEEEEREQRLSLDAEQVAFRRQVRCGGTLSERRAARREYPETPEEAMEADGAQWLPEDDLQRFEPRCRPPAIRKRLGAKLSVSIWTGGQVDALLLGLDRNPKLTGRDYTAVVGLHPRTLEQVCEIHGRAIDSELVDGIEQVLSDLVEGDRSRYLIVPERNRCHGAIAEMQRRRLRLYSPPGSQQTGFWTSRTTRPTLLDRVAEAVTQDTVRLYSSWTVAQLRGMRVAADGRVEGKPHDDLVFALALALWAAPHTTWQSDWARLWSRSRDGRPKVARPAYAPPV